MGGVLACREDQDLRDDFLRSLQEEVESQSAQRKVAEVALARLTAMPAALEELTLEGLGEVEAKLETSLRAVRAAKDKRMKEALGDEQSRLQCSVCLSKPKTSLFLPCKHLCACTECARRIMSAGERKPLCPICRAPVLEVLDVYA